MGLLQELPTQEALKDILAPVLGDEATGTGVAGVLNLLESVDTSGIAASLAMELDQAVSFDVSTDNGTLVGGALDQFQQVMTSLPKDPARMIEPLTAKLDIIRDLSSSDLSTQLLSGINGLQNVETLIPANASELVAGAAEGLSQLKGEFISGEFGQLRQWSESVQALYAEIEPLLASGPGTVEERLIAYLQEKITDLVRILLPEESLALAISAQLDGAISADRLAAIGTVRADLINSMNLARIEFENGNLTNTTHLAAAQASFQQLAEALADITAKLRPVLSQEITTADGLARALQKQLDDFGEIEIIDLGNIKDKFTAAMGRIEEAIEGLDLDTVREEIEGVFEQINDAIGQFDLSQLASRLSDLQGQLQSVLDALDGALFEAIASIRNIFTQIREALQPIASALGNYDENGDFHFHVQQDIEDFLVGIKTTLEKTVQPLLGQFENTVRQTLQQVQDGLNAVKDKIEAVQAQLRGTLVSINEQLRTLDVAGTMEASRQKLDGMLGELGDIDFDPVIDPVVAQIDEMADALKKVDVSALSEFTVGALKVSVEVVLNIDFTAHITDALMAELDELLQIPKGALKDIEASVESALQRFGELEPSMLLSPLDDLFDPITAHLDALDLASLLEPLDAWYEQTQLELDRVSPAALLQPLIDLHADLQGAIDAISPAELIRPLQEAIVGVKGQIQAIDITGIATELSGAIDRVKGLLNEISPERLLNPLVNAFDKIVGALDSFDPGVLLEPFAAIFDALSAPLDNLNADHVRLIGEAFAALRGLLDAFDPRHVFQTAQQKLAAVLDLLQQLDVGGLIAELKTPYDAMHASFEAQGGPGNLSLSASVEGLNPLRNETIWDAATDFQQFQVRLNALAGADPPAELVSRYDEIGSKLASLLPTWANENISPASIKRAFQVANPLNIATEVNQLWDAIKQQLRSFDPRIVQENVKESFDAVKETIFAFDPEEIVGEVQGIIDALTQRLDTVDLQLIADELEGLVDEVQTIIAGLNPRPIIDQLEGLVGEATGLLAALQPAEVLSELNAPFQVSKEIVAEFDPAIFKEPLQSVFEEIHAILEAIDVGVVLQPLADRLEQLRGELEEGLQRTEVAFNGMLAAIPV